jgi:hypothetical protein
VSQELVKRWSKPIAAPSMPILRAHLQLPLTEEEKAPISQNAFNDLVTPFSVTNPTLTLPADTLGTLFRVSTEQSAKKIRNLFRQIIDNTPPTDGTEEAFHHTWDANISDVLHLVLSTKDSIRNSNRNSSTALKRPDYGLLVKNHCILRGEEEGSDAAADPKRELVDKLRWTYDPLPYILGLSWIILSLKAFFCLCYRISCNYHERPLLLQLLTHPRQLNLSSITTSSSRRRELLIWYM